MSEEFRFLCIHMCYTVQFSGKLHIITILTEREVHSETLPVYFASQYDVLQVIFVI